MPMLGQSRAEHRSSLGELLIWQGLPDLGLTARQIKAAQAEKIHTFIRGQSRAAN